MFNFFVYLLTLLALSITHSTNANGEDLFGTTLSLTAVEKNTLKITIPNHYHYFKTPDDKIVATSNRLIIKTQTQLSINNLGDWPDITDAQLIAKFSNFKLFLIVLSTNKPDKISGLIREISQLQGIDYVQPDFLQVNTKNKRFFDQDTPVADRLKAPDWQVVINNVSSNKGQGVKVAVIDDGFDLSHPALQSITPLFQFDVETKTDDTTPRHKGNKHGTLVAGILWANWLQKSIQGSIQQAQFIAIRNSYNWSSDVVLALYLAYLAGADVINCSWGLPLLLDPIADTLAAISKQGRKQKGTAIVFAAGNEGVKLEREQLPQTMSAVITVAGINDNRQVSTNYGSAIDVAAPTLLPTTDFRDHNKISYIGGSSAASAVVAGVVAQLISAKPDITLDQIKTLIKNTSTPIVGEHQFGVINSQKALDSLGALAINQ